MRILRWLGIALAALVAVLVGIGVVARFSDGPIGPFPGGPLRTGTLVSEPDVDWSLAHGRFVELQLVEPLGSRITGAIVHEGQLFLPCDLGFIARRAPDTTMGWLLSPIHRFKRWHEDALRDGRVVLRFAGKRYERQAVRVTDPELLGHAQLDHRGAGWSVLLLAPAGCASRSRRHLVLSHGPATPAAPGRWAVAGGAAAEQSVQEHRPVELAELGPGSPDLQVS